VLSTIFGDALITPACSLGGRNQAASRSICSTAQDALDFFQIEINLQAQPEPLGEV
jgi:hypothetical protein